MTQDLTTKKTLEEVSQEQYFAERKKQTENYLRAKENNPEGFRGLDPVFKRMGKDCGWQSQSTSGNRPGDFKSALVLGMSCG